MSSIMALSQGEIVYPARRPKSDSAHAEPLAAFASGHVSGRFEQLWSSDTFSQIEIRPLFLVVQCLNKRDTGCVLKTSSFAVRLSGRRFDAVEKRAFTLIELLVVIAIIA